jgi:hypothetical protein
VVGTGCVARFLIQGQVQIVLNLVRKRVEDEVDSRIRNAANRRTGSRGHDGQMGNSARSRGYLERIFFIHAGLFETSTLDLINLAETSFVRASWKLPRGLVFRYRIIWKISPSGRVSAPRGEVTQPCGKGTQPLRLIFQIIPTVVLITIRGFFAAGPKVFEPSSDSLSSSPIYRIDYNKKRQLCRIPPAGGDICSIEILCRIPTGEISNFSRIFIK